MLHLCMVFDPQQALGIYKLCLRKMGYKNQKKVSGRELQGSFQIDELPNSKLPNKFGYVQKGLQEGQKKEEKEFSGIRTVGTVYILDW